MRKEEYLNRIRDLLQALPSEDLEPSLAFYAESIEDRMEDGMSEEEAVASMESPEEAARTIQMELPLPKLVKARVRDRRRMGPMEIILLVLGFPLWFPLLLTAAVLALTFYLLVWVLVLVLGVVVLSLAVSALACAVASIVVFSKAGLKGLLLVLGAGFVLAGLAILLGLLLPPACRGTVKLGKAMLRGTKSLLIRKEKTI